MSREIVLVACCGLKLPAAAPARDLYQSALFKKARAYAERHGDAWLILSAKYGVVDPSRTIEPYDLTLRDLTQANRRVWTYLVSGQLEAYRGDRLTVLAGALYCDWCPGFHVSRPLRGLGIGQQLSFLKADGLK